MIGRCLGWQTSDSDLPRAIDEMNIADQRRALRILFDTYWSPKGWKSAPMTPPDDLAFARTAGIMFEPAAMNHDEEIRRALRARDALTARQVGDAFLASLRSRRLDLRSALGSFAVARHLRAHRYKAANCSSTCAVCGRISEVRRDADLNVLNFERYKWGGVRHTDPVYIAIDLEQLVLTDVPLPSSEDRALLRTVLSTIESAAVKAKLSDVERSLSPIVKGNSAERRALMGILSYAGLLQPKERTGFFNEFSDWGGRAERPLNKDDWPYPLRWWTPQDGVNRRAASFWFPGISEA
jgi:hypothetical protein